jgi:hypothetical protein
MSKAELTPDQLKKKKRKRALFFILALLILIAVFLYFYTYVFAKDSKKIIYEEGQRRIYLLEKKEYKKGREMWRMVLEDQKTGQRFFILGNSKKGYDNKKMAEIVINTVDQQKLKSFDQVQGAGITMRVAKTDLHSNLIEKNKISDIGDYFKDLNFNGINI